MLLAVIATLIDRQIIAFELIIIGLIVGAAIGAVLAVRVQLTAMPQLVASFNGFGGAASALVAGTAVVAPATVGAVPLVQLSASSALSAVIGIATFAGSMVAFAKLQEIMPWKPRGTLGLRTLTGRAGTRRRGSRWRAHLRRLDPVGVLGRCWASGPWLVCCSRLPSAAPTCRS